MARSWLSTPYHDQASLKGVGCDCLGLARGVWREVVGSELFPIPPYSRDWGETGPHEVLAEGARRMMPEIAPAAATLALPDEPLLGALGANPYWARNWLLFGQEVQPTPGAVLVFSRGSGGHVGFAIGQDDTHFYVLGGNQSDAVTVARIARARLLGARWPATYPPRPQSLPAMKPGEFLATTNKI